MKGIKIASLLCLLVGGLAGCQTTTVGQFAGGAIHPDDPMASRKIDGRETAAGTWAYDANGVRQGFNLGVTRTSDLDATLAVANAVTGGFANVGTGLYTIGATEAKNRIRYKGGYTVNNQHSGEVGLIHSGDANKPPIFVSVRDGDAPPKPCPKP